MANLTVTTRFAESINLEVGDDFKLETAWTYPDGDLRVVGKTAQLFIPKSEIVSVIVTTALVTY